MVQWVKALIMQVNNLSSILRTHKKLYTIVCICNLSTPSMRWEAETKEISQKFTGQLACSIQNKLPKLSSNLQHRLWYGSPHLHTSYTQFLFKKKKKQKRIIQPRPPHVRANSVVCTVMGMHRVGDHCLDRSARKVCDGLTEEMACSLLWHTCGFPYLLRMSKGLSSKEAGKTFRWTLCWSPASVFCHSALIFQLTKAGDGPSSLCLPTGAHTYMQSPGNPP